MLVFMMPFPALWTHHCTLTLSQTDTHKLGQGLDHQCSLSPTFDSIQALSLPHNMCSDTQASSTSSPQCTPWEIPAGKTEDRFVSCSRIWVPGMCSLASDPPRREWLTSTTAHAHTPQPPACEESQAEIWEFTQFADSSKGKGGKVPAAKTHFSCKVKHKFSWQSELSGC